MVKINRFISWNKKLFRDFFLGYATTQLSCSWLIKSTVVDSHKSSPAVRLGYLCYHCANTFCVVTHNMLLRPQVSRHVSLLQRVSQNVYDRPKIWVLALTSHTGSLSRPGSTEALWPGTWRAPAVRSDAQPRAPAVYGLSGPALAGHTPPAVRRPTVLPPQSCLPTNITAIRDIFSGTRQFHRK